MKEKHSVTEPKHSQAFLLHFLLCKTNSGELNSPTARLDITQEAQETLRKFLTIFYLSMFLTTVDEDALLEQLPE